jgi:hypothetical protein
VAQLVFLCPFLLVLCVLRQPMAEEVEAVG